MFFPSLTFSRGEFTFSTFDQAGMINTGSLSPDINVLSFLQIIVGFMFSPDDIIGFDPTMTQSSDGSGTVQKITVNGVEYTIIECIFSSETMRGCATWCWHVSKGEKHYAIKDSWCLQSQKLEPEVLVKMVDVEGVPCFVDWEDVTLHGQIDTTATWHIGLSYS